MNWFTKHVLVLKRSAQRCVCLYKYLQELAVLLYRAQTATGQLPDPAALLRIGSDFATMEKNQALLEKKQTLVEKEQTALLAEVNRVNSRLHGIETAFTRLSTEQPSDADIKEVIIKSIEYCYVAAVPGSFAEFGTFHATTASHIARAFKAYHPRYSYMDVAHHLAPRLLYLFDSFEGLPPILQDADATSPHVTSKVWLAGACKGLSARELGELIMSILPLEQFEIIPGFYKDSMREFDPAVRFAFIHVDCDLYESAIDALDPLFARGQISPGCMILFDDWDCNHASNAHGERKAWRQLLENYSIQFTDLGGYGCVGHRFIVNSYVATASAPLRQVGN